MISYELGVDDLADTRFAVSPAYETMLSLRVLREPGLSALHLPWRRSVVDRLGGVDTELLLSLVGPRRGLPDFLTPRPEEFAPTLDDELAFVRRSAPDVVRRDLLAVYEPYPLPAALDEATVDDTSTAAFVDTVCDLLRRYWAVALEPSWPQLRLVLEADMTYRARQLAVGGARLLFADMHPNLSWRDGVLYVAQMIGRHHVPATGRGLLLIPSVFAHKPAPPVGADKAPSLVYPSRGVATVWTPAPPPDAEALVALIGAPRARLLCLLDEPLPTVELARRLGVTPSAVSQHLRVLHATGLVTRARDGRQVLYRRSELADHLVDGSSGR